MKFRSRSVRNILIGISILVALRILLPVVALAGFNYTLRHKSQDYTGQLQGLDLAILKGVAIFKNLHIEKKDEPDLLKIDVEAIHLNWSWQDLWDKKIKVHVKVIQANAVFTEFPEKKPQQPEDLTFVEARKKLSELDWATEIKAFELRHSSFKFIVPKVKVPLFLTRIDADIFNMHLSPGAEWQLAEFYLRARLQDQGEVKLNGQIQPLAWPPLADINMSLENFDLKTLNGLMLKIFPMDITRGKLNAYIEAASQKDFANGYAKIFLDDVDVVSSQQKFKSGRHVFFEYASAISHWVLKNAKEKSLAVKVPFYVKRGRVDIKTTKALVSTFANRRHKLDRKIDDSVSFSQNQSESLMR